MTTHPIINSFLDLDLYKLLMAQFLWWYDYGTYHVTYSLQNRHSDRIQLANHIHLDRLQDELYQVETLRLSQDEWEYLRNTGYFYEDFLLHLSHISLPTPNIGFENHDFHITVQGFWESAIYWETIILSIVNQLLTESFLKKEGISWKDLYQRGQKSLAIKFNQKLHPYRNQCGIVDFGTRRRVSRIWHAKVLEEGQALNCIHGTSNVYLSNQFDLPVVGTYAHELEMGLAALASNSSDKALYSAPLTVWHKWAQLYPELTIALSDTFGTQFFLDNLPSVLTQYKGVRHDSGKPDTFIRQMLDLWKTYDIDPKDKKLVCSDGLSADTIIDLTEQFATQTQLIFGWGTNLTNDMGYHPTSLVMKLSEINGIPTVKLSDNAAKATGPKDLIERYCRVFNHPDFTQTNVTT